MKFIFRDRDYPIEPPPQEFSTLMDLLTFLIDKGVDRHIFVPPMSEHMGVYNDSEDWLIYTFSDYD